MREALFAGYPLPFTPTAEPTWPEIRDALLAGHPRPGSAPERPESTLRPVSGHTGPSASITYPPDAVVYGDVVYGDDDEDDEMARLREELMDHRALHARPGDLCVPCNRWLSKREYEGGGCRQCNAVPEANRLDI